jgi:hypothetical protein
VVKRADRLKNILYRVRERPFLPRLLDWPVSSFGLWGCARVRVTTIR